MKDRWIAVDRYFGDLILKQDPVLDAVLEASSTGGLPEIAVAPNQGMLLNILARSINAKRILEVGTLGGYSTIWLARALPPGGKLITLEVEKRHADVARANFVRAGLSDTIELRLGRGVDLLPQLAAEKPAPFDFVFIDADKPSNADYFEWALKLTRKGSIIIVDNVVRGGEVADAASRDANVLGARQFAERIAAEPRVLSTVLQTVGVKGYDGFAISIVV